MVVGLINIKLSFEYSQHLGVPLIDGGALRLQATVGLSRALDLVLTGRTLSAKEAFEWGLANRLVACGTCKIPMQMLQTIFAYGYISALGQATNLAMSLIKFPQNCLLNDRKSVYNAASYEKFLNRERENAKHSLTAETIEGAHKFLSGIGRHGKSYDLKEKYQKHWELE